MSEAHPSTVVLLGAQRFQPSLGALVSRVGVTGRIALITAGWQEREPEIDELSAHLGGETVNLRLHERATGVFHRDPALAAWHRERQHQLRHLQEIYRVRLEHAFDAERDVAAYDTPAALRDEVDRASIQAIADLDRWHLEMCEEVRKDYDSRFDLDGHPQIQRHKAELQALLADCEAVAIAGGHVAVLLNRLKLFDLKSLIGARPVFAWSAGAMAISDTVVLFHDDGPQGRVARQVLESGLGLLPGVVVLPEPERRLHLDDQARVRLLSRRFSPATCLAFPSSSYAHFQDGVCVDANGVTALEWGGGTHPFTARRPEGRGHPHDLAAAAAAVDARANDDLDDDAEGEDEEANKSVDAQDGGDA